MTLNQVQEAAEAVKSRLPATPEIALILGSGLGDFADQLQNSVSIPSSDIPHYPMSTVPGHAGRLVVGRIRKRGKESPLLLVVKGRVHFYESGSLSATLFPVSLARMLGVSTLLVTNAAGGINRSFSPGDLMLITDLLSLTFLRVQAGFEASTGEHSQSMDSRFGESSPHIPLDPRLQEIIRQAAREHSVPLQEGTYCWVKGPSYETAAEIEMLSRAGADAVGMSTVPEISLGIRTGMSVAGLSLISNLATGISATRLSHQEVTETANRIKSLFSNLLSETLLLL